MVKIGEVISSIRRVSAEAADIVGKLANYRVGIGWAVARAVMPFMGGPLVLGIMIKNFFSRHIQRGRADGPRVRQQTTQAVSSSNTRTQFPAGMDNVDKAIFRVLQENWAEENIGFLFEVKQFKQLATGGDRSQILQKARQIYEKYVKPGSEQEINIDSNMRQNITNIIENQENIDEHVFDRAYNECYSLINRNYATKLQNSPSPTGNGNLYNEFVNRYSLRD